MKLISMHVDDFGGLHNYDYSFADGLNVVLHDNGWGKTTMAAFIKAMLYGYDSKRSKDITENERKRYLPWQGGKYGGSLDFEAEGVRYRIYRTFGETPRFDTAKIVNLDTKTTAKIPADKIGETLFHLDASAFQRSVFINQNGLSLDGAASSIHTRLNALVSQANDVAAYDGAIASLTQEIKVYEKTGDRGQLGDIVRRIRRAEQDRDEQERIIARQDAARERISELDVLLSAINIDLEEKNKKLDVVSGEEKKREAEKKLQDDIDAQISAIQQQIDGIKTDLGGRIPTREEVDQVKQQAQVIASLKPQIAELEAAQNRLIGTYNGILEKYGGTLPTAAQLDEIQSIYGEMQGILSSSEAVLSEDDMPEAYLAIKAAAKNDPGYIDHLQAILGEQELFRNLLRKLEAANSDLQRDTLTWKEKTKQYAALKSECALLREKVKATEAYKPSAAEPVISNLEALQKKQQILDVKKESIGSDVLTPAQEKLLREYTGELPDAAEANEILKKYRNAAQQQAKIQGLTARLDGEKSKAESLDASLAQMDTLMTQDVPSPKKPEKSSGTVWIGIGAAVIIISVVLGILVSPAVFAASAVGAVLAVFGVVNNSKHKTAIQEYAKWQQTQEQNQETVRKKAALLAEKSAVQKTVSSLERQIAECRKELQADGTEVYSWFKKWGNGGEQLSEAEILRILEAAETVKKLQTRQIEAASVKTFLTEGMSEIASARAEIDALYPECSAMSVPEAMHYLREKLNDFRVADGQLQGAVRNEEKFVLESGVTREALEKTESPREKELTAVRDQAEEDLRNWLHKANRVLSPLILDTDHAHMAQALREAEGMLHEYRGYADKLKDQANRQGRKNQQAEELQKKLYATLMVVASRYPEKALPERLSLIRNEANEANRIKAKIEDSGINLKRQKQDILSAETAVSDFRKTYGRFSSEKGDVLPAILEKVDKHAELITARRQLETQRLSVEQKQKQTAGEQNKEEEITLRAEINSLIERRDSLLVEYTQKGDFIRHADQSLEQYPDTVREIHTLYDQKQKAQNTVAVLKRAIQLITKAKENLANRYLSKVETLFNSYLRIWLNNDTVRGLLDIDFNITIEENSKVHVAEGYSTGYCDLIDFCMRLALVDTLFENEQPFLVMDDPFVNLDADRLEKALELLNVMAANKQIVYFVCHPIRAVETNENSSSRAEFVKLAEAARQTVQANKPGTASKKKTPRKSPKEMYHMAELQTCLPFKPANPDYVITNSIFSMRFVPANADLCKDSSYELFFIDEIGHVLNDRQIIEFNNGKLSTERVQFSLNTRDDSGNVFELMIRESGQDDYDVAARFPFKVKLAFTGTFSFDF